MKTILRRIKQLIVFCGVLIGIQVSSTAGSCDSCICVHEISFEGNEITRELIIRRELSLKEGDCLTAAQLDKALSESRNNLLNIAAFNFVDIKTEILEADPEIGRYRDSAYVAFHFTERWYFWPSPILIYEDRNFNSWLADRDWSRISYGLTLSHSNFRGRLEQLSVSVQYGYDRQAWLEYMIPYLDKSKTLGFSIAGGVEFLHEIPYATLDGNRQYFRGTNYMLDRKFGLISFSYRPRIHTSHRLTLGYENLQWGDTLLMLNPEMTAGGESKEQYFRLHYKLKIDHRIPAYYPLAGWYADLEMQKDGLGLTEASAPDHFFLKSTLRKYVKISDKLYSAVGVHLKLGSQANPGYYLNHGLGYGRDFLRGYEYYVIDGQAMAMLKVNIKYSLYESPVINIPFPFTERITKTFVKLYLNIHGDAGRVRDRNPSSGNIFANQWLYSGGSGLDIVTTYDKVFRIDYSVNHIGEGGFYIHFIAPI